MGKNNEANISQWVDDRLAQLNPVEEWAPSVECAFARFSERRANKNLGGWNWAWAAAAAAIVCIYLLRFPVATEITQHFGGVNHVKLVDIGQVSADVKALKDGQSAPDFSLTDADGATVRLSAYKGKVVLLNFWATWCHGCRTEIPWLIEFEDRYKDRGLVVIGVSMDDAGWKAVKPYLNEKKVNYPVVIGNDDIAKPYGLTSMPMTFLIDRKGKVVATSVGVVDKTACDEEIGRVLKQK
jgi:peroxiredoxin